MKKTSSSLVVAALCVHCASGAAPVARSGDSSERNINLVRSGEEPAGGAATSGGSAAADALQLDVEATGRSGGQAVALNEQTSLRAGDTLSLRVTANRRAWLFLAYVDSRGEPTQVYPTDEALQVEPGHPVQIPEAGYSLVLDDHPGTETLVLVATERPLAESDPELNQALATVRRRPPQAGGTTRARTERPRPQPQGGTSGGARASEAPAAAPTQAAGASSTPDDARRHAGTTLVTTRTRAVVLRRNVAVGDRLQLRADAGGVVSWRCSFQHGP